MAETPPLVADLPPKDRLYLESSFDLLIDWAKGAADDPLMAWAYLVAIRDQAELCRSILDGERPGPWAENVPLDYLAVCEPATFAKAVTLDDGSLSGPPEETNT